MEYQNPTPREDVNYSSEHPLKEFSQLLVGIGLVLLVAIVALNYTAGFFANKLPFSYETKMVAALDFAQITPSAQQARLQELADRLAEVMQLPEEMDIRVHYSPQNTINAFATLGGNVVLFEGLLAQLESEQAIAMVMAHEIAHIKLRHPIVALGKGVTLAVLASSLGGASASGTAEWLIGSSANLSLLRFSRQQERAADVVAAHALYHVYGNLAGAQQLFTKFAKLESQQFDSSAGLDLFRSHPYSQQRWEALSDLAGQRGWPVVGEQTTWQQPIEKD